MARSQRALLRICKQAETINQPSAAVSAIVALNRTHNLDQPSAGAETEPVPTPEAAEAMAAAAALYKRMMSVKASPQATGQAPVPEQAQG